MERDFVPTGLSIASSLPRQMQAGSAELPHAGRAKTGGHADTHTYIDGGERELSDIVWPSMSAAPYVPYVQLLFISAMAPRAMHFTPVVQNTPIRCG